MTPFAFYVFICLKQAKKKHPDKNLVFQMFEDACLARWEKMSDFHKKRFVTMSELDEARFNKEMGKYNSQKEEKKKKKAEKKVPEFPIRRSERKSKAEILKAKMESILSYLNLTEDSSLGLEIAPIEKKGRGIKVRTRVSMYSSLLFSSSLFPFSRL